jgi:hypothetical protein
MESDGRGDIQVIKDYRPKPNWFERNAGLGGWFGSVGTVLAILAAWWLARQEYLRTISFDNERTNSEIALIGRAANEFDKDVQSYIEAGKSGDLADNNFYNMHLNDAEFHRMYDLNSMPLTQWPTVESYDAFKRFMFAATTLVQTSDDTSRTKQIFENRLKAYEGTLQRVQDTLKVAKR